MIYLLRKYDILLLRSKSAYGVAKIIFKNISYEFAMAAVVWGGQFSFTKIFESWD